MILHEVGESCSLCFHRQLERGLVAFVSGNGRWSTIQNMRAVFVGPAHDSCHVSREFWPVLRHWSSRPRAEAWLSGSRYLWHFTTSMKIEGAERHRELPQSYPAVKKRCDNVVLSVRKGTNIDCTTLPLKKLN